MMAVVAVTTTIEAKPETQKREADAIRRCSLQVASGNSSVQAVPDPFCCQYPIFLKCSTRAFSTRLVRACSRRQLNVLVGRVGDFVPGIGPSYSHKNAVL